ncbi:hypothetical protein KPH14_001839 [Odynerus spinipes]|uniref:Glutaredoxin-2, mitochondrial n=1 Tax=Odynerus spinipes TaxID=1348599 RepID=A0AAD9RZV7_9HYME|nr:hypothetical protein KPH14_001839 [Odynerus spinipes]
MGDLPSERNPKCITYNNDFSSTQKIIMPATREMVDQLIASDQVVIFSKTRCPYCKMAKQVFDSLKQKYTAIELDDRDDADDIQTILGDMTGARTVPRVFVKGECLGGGTDIKKLYDSGELQQKL